jgi:hypothetical protein
MLSAPEAATIAYFANAEAAVTWAAMRTVAPNIRSFRDFPSQPSQPTQALPDLHNLAGTVEVVPAPQQERTKADASVAQLIKFENLAENWDGFGAAKPDRSSIRAARAFIRSLAPESVIPQPALHADGSAILFFRDAHTYAELEFSGSKVEFFARRGEKEWASEFQVGAPLPTALFEIGFSI